MDRGKAGQWPKQGRVGKRQGSGQRQVRAGPRGRAGQWTETRQGWSWRQGRAVTRGRAGQVPEAEHRAGQGPEAGARGRAAICQPL